MNGFTLIFSHAVAQADVIVPPGLEVKESNIPKAGRGVFAKCVIPKHDFFGPFVGKKVTAEEAKQYKDSPYVWEVRLVLSFPVQLVKFPATPTAEQQLLNTKFPCI